MHMGITHVIILCLVYYTCITCTGTPSRASPLTDEEEGEDDGGENIEVVGEVIGAIVGFLILLCCCVCITGAICYFCTCGCICCED